MDADAKDRFAVFQEKILTAVAGSLVWLARENYDVFLKGRDWTVPLEGNDFQTAVASLTTCINDGTRILDVHVARLESEGLIAGDSDRLTSQFSDTVLCAAQCLAQV